MIHIKQLITTFIFTCIIALTGTAQGYSITGTVTGLPDSTRIYLRLNTPPDYLDSTLVIHEKFALSGKLAENETTVLLHTPGFKQYIFFWLENKPITFSATATQFKKAVITGSATETESALHKASQAPLLQKEDSLTNLLRTAKKDTDRANLNIQLAAIRLEQQQSDKNYIKTHPASVYAASLLSIYMSTWGKAATESLYAGLNQAIKAGPYGQEINDFIQLNKDVSIGKPFADFEQANTSGNKIKLSDIKAKYVLLDFWASWCGPCRSENENLVKTYARFKDKGFAVLGVSLDDNKENWLKAIKEDKLVWENVCDLRGDKNRVALIYGIHGIPNNFLINDKGIIIARNLRGEKLDAKLSELLP